MARGITSLSGVCALVLAAAFGAVSARAADAPDLGFEEVSRYGAPLQWKANTAAPLDSVTSIVKDQHYVRSGEASVKLVKAPVPERPDAEGHLYTVPEIRVQPGLHVLEFWARGEGHVGALAYTYGRKADGSVGFTGSLWPSSAAEENPVDGAVTAADWQRYGYQFDLPAGKVTVQTIRLALRVRGTVYVDDLAWTAVAKRGDAAPTEPEPAERALRTNLLALPLSVRPPVVDGRFDVPEYPVVGAGLMSQGESDLYEYPARFGLGRDAGRLYFGLALDLPRGATLKTSTRKRDDPGLIATQDAFYMMVRPDADPEASTFEGVYLAIAPDGVLYDAWEKVSWSKGYCHRDASFNADWRVVSRAGPERWTLELSVPITDLRLTPADGTIALLSFGLNLQGRALAWQLHPNWFDHPQAFGRLRFVDRAVAVAMPDFGALARGQARPTFALSNPGPAAVPYEVTYLISTPKMIAGRIGSYIFDRALDVRRKQVVRGSSALFWTRAGHVPAGQTRREQDTGALETPAAYVLEAEVRSDGEAVFYQKTPFRFVPPITATLTPIPSRDRIVATVSVRGARTEEKGRVTLTFTDRDETVVLTHEQGLDADELSLGLSMADLAPGEHDVTVALIGRDGELAATTTVPFKKWPTPVWLSDRVGLDALEPDWVPDPWTPVEAGVDRVEVWGRQVTFAEGALVAMASSQGRPLLAAPMTIHYSIDGDTHAVAVGRAEITSLGRGRARVVQRGASAHFELSARHTIEFDGMVRIDLRLSPRAKVDVGRLWIEVPFREFPYSMLTDSSMAYWQRGLASDALFATPHAFNMIWFGDDDIGCAYFTENYKGWLVNSTKPRITLASGSGARRLKLLLVNEPSTVSDPVAVTFGLHPTPFKPRYKGWRAMRPQGLGIEPPPVSAAFVHASIWNSCDSKPSPRNWQVLEDIVIFTHARGQKALPYLGTFLISPYDNIKRDTPFYPAQGRYAETEMFRKRKDATRQEEYFYYAEDWHVRPPRVVESPQETRQHATTAAGSSWSDYFAHGIAEMLKRTDVDGFYLDIANPGRDMNEERGLTVVTKDGRREGSQELFATRDLYKRLYRVFEQSRGPNRRPWMLGHGFAVSVPYSPFWDMNFNCEEVKPRRHFGFTSMNLQDSLEGAPMAKRVDDAGRSFDAFAFRAHFGRQFGLPNVVLPQYGYDPKLKTNEHSREMLAWTFLHNNLLWPAYIPSRVVYDFWSKVEVPFGMGDTTFHGYWENGVTAKPACVRVSTWSKPDGEAYLLAAASFSDQAVPAEIALPAALAGFGSCVDMESGEPFVSEGALAVTIPAHDLRVFRFGER